MNVSDDASKSDPMARRFALIPVVIIAAAVLAYQFGFRLEGRQTEKLDWRAHTVAESNFAVTAPGMLVINHQNMNFDGESADAATYIASDLGADFSVSVVRRPDDDLRPFDEAAKGLGLLGTDATERVGGGTMFRHDVTLNGARTEAVLIFKDRMLYQLMVRSPAASFPETNAQRFFDSFHLLGQS